LRNNDVLEGTTASFSATSDQSSTQSRISSLIAELNEAQESVEELAEQIQTDIAAFTTTINDNFSSEDAQTIIESITPVIADTTIVPVSEIQAAPVDETQIVPTENSITSSVTSTTLIVANEPVDPVADADPVETHTPVNRAISGNLGIGIREPQARLDVNGSVRINGDLKLETGNLEINAGSIKISDGSQALGKILSSAEDGTATWIDPIELRLARLTENNSLNLGENANIVSSINLNLDSTKVNIKGVLSLKPATVVPSEPESGDIYFNASGALCLFILRPGDDISYGYWEQIAGLREASCEQDTEVDNNI
jgi:hypothetical protein